MTEKKNCCSKSYLWIIVCVILVALISCLAWWFISNSSNNSLGDESGTPSLSEIDNESLSPTTDDMNKTVKSGDLVTVDYIGKLVDGTIFDTNIESVAKEAGIYNPDREDYNSGLEFTVGAKNMIEGFEEAVVGMKIGESKTVEIPSEKAYGERSDDYIYHISKEEAGEMEGAEVGMQVLLGGYIPATITEITDTEYVFDANHELAGKDLVFVITVKNIETE